MIRKRLSVALQVIDLMGKQPDGMLHPLPDIASGVGWSGSYCEQVLTALRNAGIVKGMRGRNGGYALAKTLDQFTVEDVARAVLGEQWDHGYMPLVRLSCSISMDVVMDC